MTGVAAACALAAACFYAVAATLQHQAVGQEPVAKTLDPRLLLRLLRRSTWMLGFAADGVGAGLHATALALGPLALVQPLLVSGLILAVPMDALVRRRRPGRRDLLGAGASAVGLGVFIGVADPQPGKISPAQADLRVTVVVTLAAMAGLVLLAWRLPGGARATALGVAAGAGYALTATLGKAVLDRFSGDGLAVLVDPHLLLLVITGICAVVLNQNAFQAGRFAGALTGIALTDPLVSVVIAVLAYDEVISNTTAETVVEALALAVMGIGIWLVSSNAPTLQPGAPG